MSNVKEGDIVLYKQDQWKQEVSTIVNRARALVKYRGQDTDRLFTLKMDLANAICDFDSKPNK